MAKIIDINKHRNKTKNNEECEWDIVSNIFSKAINEKNFSKEQVSGIVEEIEKDIKNKFENNIND